MRLWCIWTVGEESCKNEHRLPILHGRESTLPLAIAFSHAYLNLSAFACSIRRSSRWTPC